MAHGIRSLRGGQICPICGKPDWCGFMPIEEGGEMVICMRSCSYQDVIGFDGQSYTYIANSRSGNAIYEETTQWKKRKKKNIEEWNGNNNNSKMAATNKQPSNLVKDNPVTSLTNKTLNVIYRDFLSMLTLEPHHKKHLTDGGFSENMINKFNIKSFPESDSYRFKNKGKYFSRNPWRKHMARELCKKYGTLKGLPGAYQLQSGEWTFSGRGGIIFPQEDIYGNIFCLRIRTDELEDQITKKKKNKYLSFSSSYSGYLNGTAAKSDIGIYQIAHSKPIKFGIITEGEKKAAMAADKFTDNSNCAIGINIPGVNNFRKLLGSDILHFLKEKGIKILIMAFDADKLLNKKVLACEKGAIALLKDEGFVVAVADWDIANGKGLDDLFVNGHMPYFSIV